jgi:glycosyltransferase involved in cell wall biosynthesis
MKIAIDVSPLSSGHASRGIGFYTKLLVEELQTRDDGNEYVLIKDPSELLKAQPDLIHYPFFDLFFPTAPTRQQTPIIVTLHDVTPLVLPELFPTGLKGWWNLRRQISKLNKVDFILTDSQSSKKDIIKLCKADPKKIDAIYLACDPSYHQETNQQKRTEIKQKYNLPDKYITKVGDINRHKNFRVLFDALTRIPDVHLVLPGKALAPDAPLIAELKEINEDIHAFGLEKRVHRLGFVPTEDMSALYGLARCTIQNSLYEGFGLPALESMTCGTPVIVGNTGSQPEIVGSAGIQINPQDVVQTANEIEKMFQLESSQYSQLQQRSLEQAKKFSVKKMTDETISIYERFKK